MLLRNFNVYFAQGTRTIMEITTRVGCRVACKCCPQDVFVKAYATRSGIRVMDFNTFKTCIDKLPSYVEIIFSGMSEPWLAPDCTKMIKYAHQQGRVITVLTTLVGLPIEDVDEIENIPFKYFVVHLPSSDMYENVKVDEYYLSLI